MSKKFVTTLAAAAMFTSVTIPYVAYAETANETYVEENVAFEFTTGGDFANPEALDSYFLDNFISSADLVFIDGKAYADITFGNLSYAATAIKVASTGEDAEIISSTGQEGTTELERVVRVELDTNYETAILLESQMGNFTFKFDFAQEKAPYDLTTGTVNDAYFSTWVSNVDLVENVDGERFAYVTFGEHSYAVKSIKIAGEEAEIISSTGEEGTEGYERVVRLPLDENAEGAIELDGGDRGSYTFTFNFEDKVAEPTFEETLTDEFQVVDFNITAMEPANFIIPTAVDTKFVQAKKTDSGIEFNVQTIDSSSDRGHVETVTFKHNDKVVSEASAVDAEVANFTVPSLDGLSIDVLFVDSEDEETVYTGLVSDATVVLPFSDVRANIKEIKALFDAGITTGKTPTTFEPFETMPRYQFAVMIARALELEPTTETKFADVKGEWYEKEVQALQETDIIDGFSETEFRPEQAVTRQQAAKMLLGMLEYKGYEATTPVANLDYTDIDEIADYAKPALAELQAQDIMTGYKGVLNPTGDLKREHMAKVLKRSLDLIGYDF